MQSTKEPKTATRTAIETIERINTHWLDTVLGLDRKFDVIIALQEAREQNDEPQPSGATDRLRVAQFERAEIKRSVLDVMTAYETHKRETFEYIRHHAPLSTRFYNWLVGWLWGKE